MQSGVKPYTTWHEAMSFFLSLQDWLNRVESGVGGVRSAGSITVAGADGAMGGKGTKRAECRLPWNEVDTG
jgi:hypothetical protein